MLTNLLARQFGVIRQIEVVTPRVPLLPGVALFGAADELDSALVNTVEAVAGGAVTVARPTRPGAAAVEVHVGTAEGPRRPVERFVRVLGHGWDVWVGRVAVPPDSRALSSENAFGPYFAACLAAGEVFKHLRGLKEGKGTFIDEVAMSLWHWGERPADAIASPVSPVGLALPSFYLVGAGAVGQAAGAVLAASRVEGHASIIDKLDETIEETNLNRYALAATSDLEKPKAPVIGRFLRKAGISVHEYGGGWPQYAYAVPHTEQPLHLQELEAEYKYEWVLSCVDKNRARHEIQNFWPRYIIGGSTDDLSIQVTGYDMRGPYECLKCANPVLPDRTIEEIAAELRALPAEQRRAAILARGLDVGAIEKYLWEPKCGELGEQELQRFRTEPEQADWSVGFVSVASGVLLAAQFVKLAVGGPGLAFPLEQGATLRYNFLNPEPRRSFHRRSSECECGSGGQRHYSELWGQEGLSPVRGVCR